MGITPSLQKHLDGRDVRYDVVTHEPTKRSSATAKAGGIAEDNLAKGVLVCRKDGYILAIIPTSLPRESRRARYVVAAAGWLGE
ncbi:hypothetical protein [Hyphomicrobium sp. 2TAF46]|uniref:hypothetical protein n=1 Tax=Hyphomicrobium sp. 2TAF46 TaxID=3233019 RepID=UPI003F8F83FB